MKARRVNTAELAERCGLSRSRLRKVISGDEPMLVDELMAMSQALEISPSDLGWPGESDTNAEDPQDEADADTEEVEEDDGGRLVAFQATRVPLIDADPFGNHVEQLVRMGFELGCTFLFWVRVDQLGDSGVPEHVLDSHRERGDLLIRLEDKFHRYNNPVFGESGITLTLSFDQLYDCTFPWSAIHKVIFDVGDDEDPDDPPQRPHLRLVT